jgi:magnesium transporter
MPLVAHVGSSKQQVMISYSERMTSEDMAVLAEWADLCQAERIAVLGGLPQRQAADFFLGLSTHGQLELLLAMSDKDRRAWLRLLPPDDLADLLQAAGSSRQLLASGLNERIRLQVNALLAYKEDHAGGLMSPRFARCRPEMTADEAIAYVRLQANEVETIHYVYVLDQEQRLLGVLSLRDLFNCPKDLSIRGDMQTDYISVPESMDQEAVAGLFARSNLIALPVIGPGNQMKGIITVDDIVDVVNEEASEDIQKLGGMQALHAPYMEVGVGRMVRKRAGWLALLFISEMLTATAMARYQDEIAKAVVLAIFVPLIISSGGNAGSQASTLVIRAMAVGDLRVRDWWRVLRRELPLGGILGIILAVLGVLRIFAWQAVASTYGDHASALAATVGLSLVGVVLWGTMFGSLLPFVLRAIGLDPASASAPFVATMVDVSGLVIYFNVARAVLQGSLL